MSGASLLVSNIQKYPWVAATFLMASWPNSGPAAVKNREQSPFLKDWAHLPCNSKRYWGLLVRSSLKEYAENTDKI